MTPENNVPIHLDPNRAFHLENVSALQRFKILDSAPEAAFDHIVEIASRVFSVPIVLVSLIDLNRQWFKAKVGLDLCETNLDVSFCTYAVRQHDVMVIPDATKDIRFANNELVKAPDGIRFYAGAPLRTTDGFVVGTLCLVDGVPHLDFGQEDRALLAKLAVLVVDLMEGRASHQASLEAKSKLEDFTTASLDIFWETDVEHRFTRLSSETMLGVSASANPWDAGLESMVGHKRWDILNVDTTREPWRSHLQLLDARKPFRDLRYAKEFDGKLMHFSVSGRPVFDKDGTFLGYRGATQNVTEQEQSRLEAERLANSDPLTGLANRRCWNTALRDRLNVDKVPPTGILLFDVDRFKDINDALGHAVGDRLLIDIAKRIVNCSVKTSLAARLGGDEFALLIEGTNEETVRSADCILQAMTRPFEIDGHNLHVELSIGIKLVGPQEHECDRIMVDADLALRTAKLQGRRRHVVYDPSMRKENDSRITLTAQFERALQNNEFELHFQPQMRLSNDTIVGVESLLRWNHPERGLLYPNQFLNALETSAFDIPAGQQVIDLACKQARIWQDLGTPVRVGINVSASQLYGDNLPKVLDDAMTRHGTAATMIEVEVTERVALGNVEKITSVLEAIRELGITIAFDDFGTGFASLSSLMQFPLDRVKVDQRFITDLHKNPANTRLTSGLIRLCHSLGFEVIAEGVEKHAHETFLRKQNCDEVQGYLYSKPVGARQTTDFLIKGKRAQEKRKQTG